MLPPDQHRATEAVLSDDAVPTRWKGTSDRADYGVA